MNFPVKKKHNPFGLGKPESFENAREDGLHLEDLIDTEAVVTRWLKQHKGYPSFLEKGFVHQVIIKVDSFRYEQGINGEPMRYIMFDGYHILTRYHLPIKGRYFPIMFPIEAFTNMWIDAVLANFNAFKGMLLEIHFKKKTKYTYQAMYVAQVRQTKPHHFERLEVFFKEKRYKGDEIK